VIQRDERSSLAKAYGLYFSGHSGKQRQGAWGLPGVREAIPAALWTSVGGRLLLLAPALQQQQGLAGDSLREQQK